MPGAFVPELCKSQSTVPEGDDWLHETKWDGYRMVSVVTAGTVRIWSRNSNEWTARLPELVRAVEALGLSDAHLDGEIVVLRDGRSDFNRLLDRLAAGAGAGDALAYALFDLPRVDGLSQRKLPLLERKERLRDRVERAAHPALIYSGHQIGNGAAAFAKAADEQQEGIVSKRIRSCYCDGERNGDWLKIKCRNSDEFVVIGYTSPDGQRGVGKLILAARLAGELVYCGRVGTGLTRSMTAALEKLFGATAVKEPQANIELMSRLTRIKAHWVQPHLVVEVYHQGLGNDGKLRHASLKALRPDRMESETGPGKTG